ncbi:MAG: hypothetical protein HC913_13370 [Microscillaceae bacterium]|nr:hypothetical protein [Microscillaceae bacterium]
MTMEVPLHFVQLTDLHWQADPDFILRDTYHPGAALTGFGNIGRRNLKSQTFCF